MVMLSSMAIEWVRILHFMWLAIILWNLNHPLGNGFLILITPDQKCEGQKEVRSFVLRWLYAQPLCVCVHAPASQCVNVCLCMHLYSTVCVYTAPCVAMHIQCVHTLPRVSPIVLSGSDRMSTTVCEKGYSREKIAALQLSSQWWLLCGDYTATLLSTWKDMNGTTTTELTNTP